MPEPFLGKISLVFFGLLPRADWVPRGPFTNGFFIEETALCFS